MSEPKKLICPICGSEMNHHAMKIEFGEETLLRSSIHLGGVLNEVHTCPNCGHIELRAQLMSDML